MIRFVTYHGKAVWIAPSRILYVEDGGSGSRGVATDVRLDTGETVTLNERSDDVRRRIEEALALPADAEFIEIRAAADDDHIRLHMNKVLPSSLAAQIVGMAGGKLA